MVANLRCSLCATIKSLSANKNQERDNFYTSMKGTIGDSGSNNLVQLNYFGKLKTSKVCVKPILLSFA